MIQENEVPPFSTALQEKIQALTRLRSPTQIGQVSFASKLLLAPMSSICRPAFRLLMEDLGAGGTVSELVSATGLFFKNQQTQDMLRIHPKERHVGLQIFGDDLSHLTYGAQKAQEAGARFVDLNMGCPVKKVVCKGAGSAMLKEPHKLAPIFQTIKKSLQVPFSIKIRTGWSTPNADEILHVAKEEGIEFVSLHGRTRDQQYRGQADWEYIESLAQTQTIPLLGNGDLHTPSRCAHHLKNTACHALLLGRGPLRNPFIFLESYREAYGSESDKNIFFTANDYGEICERFSHYLQQTETNPRKHFIQLQKISLWFSAGLPHSVQFRTQLFDVKDADQVLQLATQYFSGLDQEKNLSTLKDCDPNFMNGGHG